MYYYIILNDLGNSQGKKQQNNIDHLGIDFSLMHNFYKMINNENNITNNDLLICQK